MGMANGKDKAYYEMTPEQALDKLDKTFIGNLGLKIVLTRALEKQIAKKPIPTISKYTGLVICYRCPSCDNAYLGNAEYRFYCCEACGQKFDWEE